MIVNSPKIPQITFIRVASTADKISCISSVAAIQFSQNQKILILTDTKEAAQYIDELLWKEPRGRFLPHRISESACDESIAITTQMQNINSASVLVNLKGNFCNFAKQFTSIFELADESHPSKRAIANQKYQAYRTLGFSIEILDKFL